MADYIPSSDTAFQVWVNNFVTYANTHLPELGMIPPDIIPVSSANADFAVKMTANATAQQAAQSARQAKSDSRDVLEAAIRQFVRKLQASSSVNDAERVALGITVADTVKTMAVGGILTRPIGVVDTSQRLRHEIRFSDEATPTKRAKPAGVMGCEIWVSVAAVGEAAPSSADGLSFLSLDTASPYIAEYDGKEGGKTAHYMLRWVKTGGEKGPWSETVSATISA